MTPETAAILDHIVILVPYSTLLNLPTWLTDAFTISPGGRHADGVTENKLILFSDGVYLELIAFVPGKEAERERHRWGHRREGTIIDWANTLQTEEDLDIVRDLVRDTGVGFEYDKPVEGGRTRPDGVELKWVTSSWFIEGDTPGYFAGEELPFWCVDRTPREFRVPYKTAPDATSHHSEALGVAGLTVSVADGILSAMLKYTYDAIQGIEGRKAQGVYAHKWPLHLPDEELVISLAGLENRESRLSWPSLCLMWSDNEEVVNEKCLIKLYLLSKSKTGTIGGELGEGLPYLEIELVSSGQ
ncbi:hypothetical protein N0V93_000797 [Gnomoniopsis smithogilvyi]|uniref:Glyoxalase-like domain-containing protein n=1 Tax=Gnomoniopsis smithogilvyi TaxID=1191159 RepID=A0A9W9D243_9PEZI|nr:hypothetical protein N0V93_000797 [Gnomoniopsis smithogilvyi]